MGSIINVFSAVQVLASIMSEISNDITTKSLSSLHSSQFKPKHTYTHYDIQDTQSSACMHYVIINVLPSLVPRLSKHGRERRGGESGGGKKRCRPRSSPPPLNLNPPFSSVLREPGDEAMYYLKVTIFFLLNLAIFSDSLN